MILKIKGEHHFFLFQDIVSDLCATLKWRRRFPIKNKHGDHQLSSKYIYDSWYEVFVSKLSQCHHSEFGQDLIDSFSDWMVTTNIAITTAQKGRGRENIPKWELEALDKYEPSFLIEHLDDYETYRVHLDGKILILFEEAMHFHQAMEQDFNEESFKALLQRYYVFEDDLLSQELPLLCAHFEPDGDYSKYVQTYEVEEH